MPNPVTIAIQMIISIAITCMIRLIVVSGIYLVIYTTT